MQPIRRESSGTTHQSTTGQTLGTGVLPAQTPTLKTIPIKGTIRRINDKIILKTSGGTDKPISDELIKEYNLEEMIDKEAEAVMDLADMSIVGIKGVKNVYVVKKSTTPIVPPKADFSTEAIDHSYDRHTLRGIFRLGKLETTYSGDDVAIFPLDTTYEELERWLGHLHGKVLKWNYRDSSQCTAVENGIKVIGVQTGNKVQIETAFPTDYSLPKEFLQFCLDEDKRKPFRDFKEFLDYVERNKPKRK